MALLATEGTDGEVRVDRRRFLLVRGEETVRGTKVSANVTGGPTVKSLGLEGEVTLSGVVLGSVVDFGFVELNCSTGLAASRLGGLLNKSLSPTKEGDIIFVRLAFPCKFLCFCSFHCWTFLKINLRYSMLFTSGVFDHSVFGEVVIPDTVVGLWQLLLVLVVAVGGTAVIVLYLELGDSNIERSSDGSY